MGGDRGAGVYVISVAAHRAGVHIRTLRIYEVEGLLSPERTPGNQRHFSDEDLERVRLIRLLTQQFGLSLAGVKLLFALREADRFEFEELVEFAEGKDFERRPVAGDHLEETAPGAGQEESRNG